MSQLSFSKSYLEWTINYLCEREQFVQVDDKRSSSLKVNFGVSQGSIMGPLLFNIYVADLQSTMTNKCHQYADDTTLSAHAKPIQLDESISSIKSDLTKLEDWEERCNLAINPAKTKCMVISTKQMSTAHSLDSFKPDLSINGITIERLSFVTEITRNTHRPTSLLGGKHQASIVILLCYFGNFEKTQKHFTF